MAAAIRGPPYSQGGRLVTPAAGVATCSRGGCLVTPAAGGPRAPEGDAWPPLLLGGPRAPEGDAWLSHVQLFVIPLTKQSMEFSRPEYWSE